MAADNQTALAAIADAYRAECNPASRIGWARVPMVPGSVVLFGGIHRVAGGKAKPQSHMRFTGAERRACEERCTGALPGLSATQKKAPQQASATQARAPQEQAPRRKSAVLGGGFCHRLFGGESKETKASKKGTTSQQAKIVRQLARQESLNYGESWEDLTSKARPESSRRRSTDPAARAAGTASPNERLRI